MYYRYKSKEKNNSFIKIFLGGLILAGILFGLYSQRERLMFWKMSERKIASMLQSDSPVESPEVKTERLRTLEKNALKNCEKNPYNAAAQYMYAAILFGLGESLSELDFSRYCISSGERIYSEQSIAMFYDAIRHIRKGMSVEESRVVPDDVLIKLAYMYYITGYYSEDEIVELTDNIASPNLLADVHGRRFFAFMRIKSGDIANGIDFLQQYGGISSFQDRFFLASMYAAAGQYTDAINLYVELQREAPDKGARQKIARSLGDLYFRQMLYSEALAQYLSLLQDTPGDPGLTKSIGLSYEAMGDKENASLYLSDEVLVQHSTVD